MATPNPRHIDSLVRKTADRIFGLMKDYSHRDLTRPLATQSHRFPITLKKPNAWGETKGEVEVKVYRVEDLLREKAPGITDKKSVYTSGLMVNGTKIVLNIALPTDFGSAYYETLYMKMIETLKHEMEHWYQVPIGKPGSLQKDYTKGTRGKEGGSLEYFLQPIEIEAHVAGLYLQAKKMRKSGRKHMAEVLDDSQERYGFSDADKKKIYAAWMKELKKRYPMANPLPNPIDKRLDFVRKQYGQETYEKTREIVAKNLGIAEADIAPGQRVDWEKFIPWLGKQVHKLLKQGPRAASELERLERGFLASVQPFMKKVKGRRADIARLSPKRARQFAGRQQRAVATSREEQAKKLGHKTVAKLGDGYTAVQAIIDPKAPEFPHDTRLGPQWVAKYAPFQHWLGVELGNCLQFYRVNYSPHGITSFDSQRFDGAKLYGILNREGKPVAAISTTESGVVREVNGPGNRPPKAAILKYVDKFVEELREMEFRQLTPGQQKRRRERLRLERLAEERQRRQREEGAARQDRLYEADNARRRQEREAERARHAQADEIRTAHAFHPPANFPKLLEGAIETLLDYWPDQDLDGRQAFLNQIQHFATQRGIDFSKVWRDFAVYLLVDSEYALQDPTWRPRTINQIIRKIAALYRDDAPKPQYKKQVGSIGLVEKYLDPGDQMRSSQKVKLTFEQAQTVHARQPEILLMYTLRSLLSAGTVPPASAGAKALGAEIVLGGIQVSTGQGDAWSRHKAENLEVITDYAEFLLNSMREAPAGNPTGARALIKDCQTTWESYCEKPGKTRLKKVFVCLRRMEKSKASTVMAERRRCLRSARAEARVRGWEV